MLKLFQESLQLRCAIKNDKVTPGNELSCGTVSLFPMGVDPAAHLYEPGTSLLLTCEESAGCRFQYATRIWRGSLAADQNAQNA